MKLKKAKRKQAAISAKELLFEPLTEAVSARIYPLLVIGSAGLIVTIITLFFRATRGITPFLAFISLAVLGYGLWLKYDVLSRGYTEMLFKVVGYSYLTGLSKTPTGMLLSKVSPADESERGLYHIAVSGKDNIPPVGWLVRAYIPSGLEPAEYSGKKYFSSIYGYKIEREEEE